LFKDIATLEVASLAEISSPHTPPTPASECTGVETMIFEVAATVEQEGARVVEEAAVDVHDELEVVMEVVERLVRIAPVVGWAGRVESCEFTEMLLESTCRAHKGEREGEGECARARGNERETEKSA